MAPTASTPGNSRKAVEQAARVDSRLFGCEPGDRRQVGQMAVDSQPKTGSTDCTCWKLRRKRPAPTRSTSEIVSCAITSALRHRS